MLDSYARCRLCEIDLEVSSGGLVTFLEHVRGKMHMLRDSAFGSAHQMLMLTEDRVSMTPPVIKRRLRLVEDGSVPVLEPEFIVAQAIKMEREGGSVWERFFDLVSEVNSTSRLWLTLMNDHICGRGCFEDVISPWHSVKQILPNTEALDSIEISDGIILVNHRSQCALMVLKLQCKIFVVFV